MIHIFLFILPITILYGQGDDCCMEKIWNNKIYTLVNSIDDVSYEYGCYDNCVYKMEGIEDPHFCFKHGGGPASICKLRVLRERKNISTLDNSALTILNNALGAMKANTDKNDWTSFENVANFHGAPFMCKDDWNISYPEGLSENLNDSRPCCVHHRPETPYFVSWHRLFMVQFEEIFRSYAEKTYGFVIDDVAIPYWDWTQVTNSSSGLPALVEDYPEWKHSLIKGEEKNTTREAGNRFADPSFIEVLRTHVQLAYCGKNYTEFNTRIQNPHDYVHNYLGGSMPKTIEASYDPVFYLHHSFVDQQYAYWQELQTIRNLSQFASNPNREMPPFSGYTPAPVNPNVPNPLYLTKKFDTQGLGLNYQSNFNYYYDKLIFDGVYPHQFQEQYHHRCLDKYHIGFSPIDYALTSKNYIYINFDGERKEVAVHSTFAMFQSPNYTRAIHHLLDATKFFDDNNFNLENSKTIHYEVETFDENDQLIENNLYKPTFEYFDSLEVRTVRYHVSHFDKYCNFTKIYGEGEDIILEFLEDDGSYSNGVTSDGKSIPPSKYHVSKDTACQEFVYGEFKIVLIFRDWWQTIEKQCPNYS